MLTSHPKLKNVNSSFTQWVWIHYSHSLRWILPNPLGEFCSPTILFQGKSFLSWSPETHRMFNITNLCSRAKPWLQRHGEEGEESPAAHPGGCSDFRAAHHCPAVHGEAEESPRSVEERWGLEFLAQSHPWGGQADEIPILELCSQDFLCSRQKVRQNHGKKNPLFKLNLLFPQKMMFQSRHWRVINPDLMKTVQAMRRMDKVKSFN